MMSKHARSINTIYLLWLAIAVVIGGTAALIWYMNLNKTAAGQANNNSESPSLSAKGRYVAFSSAADNLVPDDTNGSKDVFIKDTQTGETTLVSTAAGGSQGNGDSWDPSISGDGRYVAFTSQASNFVENDTNTCTDGDASWNCADIFVKNTQTGEIKRVSVSETGEQGDWFSESPSISGAGRFVAFTSYAANLVEGDANNMCGTDEEPRNCADVFVKDTETGAVVMASMTPELVRGDGDSTEPAISSNGLYVAFTSAAANLASNDVAGSSDVFIKNLTTQDITRLSLNKEGEEGLGDSYEPSISGDGQYVAFASEAPNLAEGDIGMCTVEDDFRNCTDIFIADFFNGTLARITKPVDSDTISGNSFSPSISADGRVVAYASTAGNLVSGKKAGCPDGANEQSCADIFVTNTLIGTTTIISTATNGEKADWGSQSPVISADGLTAAFMSFASNLVRGDTDACTDGETYWNCADIFFKKIGSQELERISTASAK